MGKPEERNQTKPSKPAQGTEKSKNEIGKKQRKDRLKGEADLSQEALEGKPALDLDCLKLPRTVRPRLQDREGRGTSSRVTLRNEGNLTWGMMTVGLERSRWCVWKTSRGHVRQNSCGRGDVAQISLWIRRMEDKNTDIFRGCKVKTPAFWLP